MHKVNQILTAWALSIIIATTAGAQPDQIVIADSLSGEALLNFIVNQYKPTNTLGYTYARDVMYGQIDLLPRDSLRGVYSGYTIFLDTNEDPSTDAYNKGINAEHTWPQSMGAGAEPQRSDLHNLFPAKDNVNSSRGNKPFAESPDTETDTWYWRTTAAVSIPTSNIDLYAEVNNSRGIFEPREDHKGNAARAAFYFYAMYQSVANDNFFDVQKDVILDWSYLDPVDQVEYDRTWAIASYQDDKPNPFVLDSTLARRIWFTGDTSNTPEPDTLLLSESFEQSTGAWRIYSASGNFQWERDNGPAADGNYSMLMNGYGDNTASDDWLISPPVNLSTREYEYAELTYAHFYDYSGPAVEVKIATDYNGSNPESATWETINNNAPPFQQYWEYQEFDLSDYLDSTINIAFHYTSTGTGPSAAALWRVDDVQVGANLPEAPGTLMISEVADPENMYSARFVEIYNPTENLIDFNDETWVLVRQANGGSTADVQLTGSIGAEGAYLIASDIEAFTGAYGFAPDRGSIAITGNGNDGYFLYRDGNETIGTLVDAYGELNVDGEGSPWDYTDGHAVRNPSVTAPSSTWTGAEWTIEKPATTADMTPGLHVTPTADDISLPTQFTVFPAYPNPFNPTTTIEYSVPQHTAVQITVFNLKGQVVEKIIPKETGPGTYAITFNLSDESSGMYFVRVATPEFHKTQKILLVK